MAEQQALLLLIMRTSSTHRPDRHDGFTRGAKKRKEKKRGTHTRANKNERNTPFLASHQHYLAQPAVPRTSPTSGLPLAGTADNWGAEEVAVAFGVVFGGGRGNSAPPDPPHFPAEHCHLFLLLLLPPPSCSRGRGRTNQTSHKSCGKNLPSPCWHKSDACRLLPPSGQLPYRSRSRPCTPTESRSPAAREQRGGKRGRSATMPTTIWEGWYLRSLLC